MNKKNLTLLIAGITLVGTSTTLNLDGCICKKPQQINQEIITSKLEKNNQEISSQPTFQRPPIGIPHYLPENEIKQYIEKIIQKTNIPKEITPKIIIEVIKKESSKNQMAYNGATQARGLMGIKEIAWEQVWGTKEGYIEGVYHPEKNIETGIKYLNYCYEYGKRNNPNWKKLSTKEKLEHILGMHNEGPTRLKNNNWIRQNTKYTHGII